MGESTGTTLANWREHPFSVHGFTHVDQLIRTERIAAGAAGATPFGSGPELDLASIPSGSARARTAADLVAASHTDGLLVLHRGKVVHEQYGAENGPSARHIIFSVTKSVCGALAGVLVEKGQLDPDMPVIDLLPEVFGSAYGDCTIRHVLDMTVSVRFIEDYVDPLGDVARYRVAMDWNPPGAFPYQGGLHAFLPTLPKDSHAHGHRFHYVSPNSDLLGWVLERAGGTSMAALLSEHLWAPLGAEQDALITVDRQGAARTAGGLCASLRDLGRFGEMMRCEGHANGRQIIPAGWIGDIRTAGDPDAWSRGEMTGLFAKARYRNYWYAPEDGSGTFMAIGIHGQWIYIDPRAEITIVKLSSQPVPSDEALDRDLVAMFRSIGASLS